MVKIQQIDDELNRVNGVHASSAMAPVAIQPNNRPLGWGQHDTLSSYEQDKQKSPTCTQHIGDWFGSFFHPKPIEALASQGKAVESTQAIEGAKPTAPLSEVQKQNIARVQSRFDALMERFNKDCPNMDIDQVMELLFY